MNKHDRIAKLFIDLGRAEDQATAVARMAVAPLQLVLGPEVAESETLQITALLAADCGRRAFPAGVAAVVPRDGVGLTNWTTTTTLSQALMDVDVEIVTKPLQVPTVVIGDASLEPVPAVCVAAVPRGWSGGAVDARLARPDWRAGILGAAAAASVAVCEVFAAVHGLSPRAARRSAGISSWAPLADWASDAAVGPPLRELVSQLWLLGLGHLGQAYAWLARALPYETPAEALIVLQDHDVVEAENFATQLLASAANVGELKTKVTEVALEAVGYRVRRVDRIFDHNQVRQPQEPATALVGLHDNETRQLLSGARWGLTIDAGLGATADTFTQILVRRVGLDSQDMFAAEADVATIWRLVEEIPAYRNLADADPCGALIAAGKAIGTSFVGAGAAVMVFAELLRPLHSDRPSTFWALNLRSPGEAAATMAPHGAAHIPAASTSARELRARSAN